MQFRNKDLFTSSALNCGGENSDFIEFQLRAIFYELAETNNFISLSPDEQQSASSEIVLLELQRIGTVKKLLWP